MESIGGPCPHVSDGPAVVSARTLRRVARAVYIVVVKKQQPKLAALGVHLNRLLSTKRHRPAALTYLSSSLSCRSMDPAAAVVHPLPRHPAGGHRRRKSSRPVGSSLSSLSCRSMDPAAAVHQYRPREVQFSCKSTPPHKRRRAQRHALELEYHSSAAAVSRLFELMDVEEATDVNLDDGKLDLEEAAAAWPALSVGPAPRQVRITDSPFAARQEDDDDRLVDHRADEFITWFHEQLRTQQQCAAVRDRGTSYYWVR